MKVSYSAGTNNYCDWNFRSYTWFCSLELLRTDRGTCFNWGCVRFIGEIHGKCLNFSNLAVFPNTVVLDVIVLSYDSIARASHGYVTFLKQLGSFLFSLYCLCEVKMSHDVKMKMTRSDKMPSQWLYKGQNGHMNSPGKWTFTKTFWNCFCMPNILPPLIKLPPKSEKIQWQSYDGLRISCPQEWCDVLIIRVFPLSHNQLVSILGQCDIDTNTFHYYKSIANVNAWPYFTFENIHRLIDLSIWFSFIQQRLLDKVIPIISNVWQLPNKGPTTSFYNW